MTGVRFTPAVLVFLFLFAVTLQFKWRKVLRAIWRHLKKGNLRTLSGIAKRYRQ